MKRFAARGVLVALLAFITLGAAQAGNILAFEDFVLGTSALPGALTLYGGCGTCTITNNTANFNSLLTGGTWDLVIYAEQNTGAFPGSQTELTNWVSGGGRVIGQTWQPGGLDGLLEATPASINGSVITTDGHPIFTGLGPTMTLINPGWGVYSQGYTPLGGAVSIGTWDSVGAPFILGNGGRTIMNAGLTDTYLPLADGERLIANEIGFLLGGAGPQVPEPSTFVALALGLLAIGSLKLRKR